MKTKILYKKKQYKHFTALMKYKCVILAFSYIITTSGGAHFTWLVFHGVDLPREKRVEIGLTYIYGIGRTSARSEFLKAADVNPDTRVRDLTDDEVRTS